MAHSFTILANGKMEIRQKGWGTLVYDRDDIKKEIEDVQKERRNYPNPEDADGRISVLIDALAYLDSQL
jgi:hypothetical protein